MMKTIGRVLTLAVSLVATLPAATIRVCSSGCDYSNFQTALNAAQLGDTIELASGETFVGNFRAPLKTQGDGYITITSSRAGELPPEGYRVGPEHAPLMATLSGPVGGAILSFTGAGKRLVGEDLDAETVVTSSAHGFSVGDSVFFWGYGGQYGTLPAPLVSRRQMYYVVNVPTPTSFKVSVTPDGEPVNLTGSGADYDRWAFPGIGTFGYRVVGLEIKPDNGANLYALVEIGAAVEGVMQAIPHHIELHRNYIHGNENQPGPTRCVAANGAYLTIRDNYITECKDFGPDTQAIACWNCPGPISIENNYLAGAGENILIGGSGTAVANLLNGQNGQPGFIIQNNHFHKPLTWKWSNGSAIPTNACLPGEFYRRTSPVAFYRCNPDGTTWSVTAVEQRRYTFKNLFELKNAVNVVLSGNIFENSWVDAQGGGTYAGAQVDDFNLWSTVKYVNISNNISRHSTAGINFGSYGTSNSFTEPFSALVLDNNLIYDVHNPLYDGPSNDGVVYGNTAQMKGVVNAALSHNTFVGPRVGFVVVEGARSTNLLMRDMIFAGAGIGCQVGWGCDCGHADFAPGMSLRNVFVMANQTDWQWPGKFGSCATGMLFAPDMIGKFVDPANGNFRLVPGSPGKNAATDTKDVGVDMDELDNATSGVVAGTPAWSRQAKLRLGSANGQAAVIMYDAPSEADCSLVVDDHVNFSSPHADTATAALQLDSRAGNLRDGPFRQFLLGRNSSLSPSTQYYVKLTCGNRIMPLSFFTAPSGPAEVVDYPLQLNPPEGFGVAKVDVLYGSSDQLGSSVEPVDCASACTITFPVARQGVTYWQFRYIDSAGQVLSSSAKLILALQ